MIWLALLVLLPGAALAAVCTSEASGNWSTNGIWSCWGGPDGNDTVVIAAGHTVTLNENATIEGITVNGTLNVSGTRRLTLTDSSTLFALGPNGSFVPGNSTVVMNRSADTTLTSGAITFNNLELVPSYGNRTGDLEYNFGSGAITINGDFIIDPYKSSGGSRILYVNMGAPITVAGTTTIMGSGGRATGVLQPTMEGNHPLTSGRLVIGSNGRLTADEAVITLNGSTGPLFTLSSSGEFWEDTSTVVMQSPSSVVLNSGSPAFANLVIDMPGRTGTLGDQIHVQNTLAINAGTLDMAGHMITSNWWGPRNMTMAPGTELIIGRDDDPSMFPTGFPRSQISLAPGSTVIYRADVAQTISSTPVYANLILASNSSNQVSKSPSGALDIDGDLTIGSNTWLSWSTDNHTLAGNFINNSSSNAASNSNFIFDGSTPQQIAGSSATAFRNLEVDNVAGVSATHELVVNSNLTLTNGRLSAGTNRVSVTANCTSAVHRTNGYVDGKLRLTFPASSNATCTYPVGSGGYYAPISVLMNSGGGTLTGWTTAGEHSQIASSGINPNRNVNRYWSLGDSGDSLPGPRPITFTPSFGFPAADVDSGASPNMFVGARRASGDWTKYTDTTNTADTTTLPAISDGIPITSTFALGEDSDPCPVPDGFVTCVCDNFARTSLNPSTIFNSDWITSRSGGSYDVKIVNNYLRLTDSSSGVATSATVPGMFPAAGNNITVEFLHYAYGGGGADGIALTLSDSTATPTAGAFGGSLGYAQKCQQGTPGCNSDCTKPGGCPGFNGGWLGVGIDEWGNFANSTEGRVGGTGQIAQSVTLRGSGSGASSAPGNYPFLATSGALSPAVDFPNSSTRERGHRYRITVDARCYESNNQAAGCNNPGLERQALVKVERDATGTGNAYVTLPNLNLTNIYDHSAAQQDVPENWKLSFTGSTGGVTNIHEIKGLKVCSTAFTPPSGFDIQASTTTSPSCATPDGTPSSPVITIQARNHLGQANPNYVGTVTLSARLPNGALAPAASWRRVGSAADIPNGGAYTFVPSDNGSAQFYLSNSTNAVLTLTVSDASASTTSPVPITFSATAVSYTIENADPGAEPVAGRPHLMKVTHVSGCSASNIAGTKDMSGWYQPDVAHPDGAEPPRMCPAGGTPAAPSCFPDASPQTCGNPVLGTSPPATSNLTLAFNGQPSAYFCLKTTDVGKFRPQLQETADPSIVTTSSPTMTMRPFAIVVSGVKAAAGGAPNPGGGANGGARFVPAGADFQATVGGYLWNEAGDPGRDGMPDAGATLGQLTGAGLAPSYADQVQLTASGFQPAGGVGGTLDDNEVEVADGSGSKQTVDYSEVGAFELGAAPSGAYLQTPGADLQSRVAVFARLNSNPAGTLPNRLVGRFYPHHFAIRDPYFEHGCGANAFTYQGQPFKLGFTIEAQNLDGVRTGNYGVSGYGPVATGPVLSLVAKNGDEIGNLNAAGRITPALPSIAAPVSQAGWGDGSPAFPYGQFVHPLSPYVYTRAATPEAPLPEFTVGVGIADNSGDAVPLADRNLGPDVEGACSGTSCAAFKLGTTDMRYGRLKIDNTYGSELLPLTVGVEAQYWNGTHYVRNTADNCTSLVAGNFQLTGHTGIGVNDMTIGANFGVAQSMSDGSGRIRLLPPAAITQKGSVVLETNPAALPWLPGAGRQTFGVYKGGPVIYMRERY